MKNAEKYTELRTLVNKKLKALNARNKNAVEIYGNLVYLTENQLRALQVIVKEAFEEDRAKGLELQENIIIYDSLRKRKSSKTISICNNGYLDEPLLGFYDINTTLSYELL